MKTSPESCNTCEHRFKCFTVRTKQNDKEVSSKSVPYLSDIMKEVDKIGTD